MENVYDKLVMRAENIVKIDMESYDESKVLRNVMAMYSLLLGLGNGKVEYNGSGHNYKAAIDGVHKYYKDYKDERVPKIYNDCLMKITNYAIDVESVQKAYSILGYELKKQKDGTASLKPDVKAAYQNLIKIIDENYSKLSMEKINFSGWKDGLNKDIQDNYGDFIK